VSVAHATQHWWSFLRHVTDVDAVIRTGVEWDEVRARAHAVRVERMLRIALVLAGDWQGTPVPSPAMTWARADAEAVALARRAAERWFDPAATPPHRWAQIAWNTRYRERVADKVRYVVRDQLTSLVVKLPWERRLMRRRSGRSGGPPRIPGAARP